jgi:hypothetical protein
MSLSLGGALGVNIPFVWIDGLVEVDAGEPLPALADVNLIVVMGGPMSVNDGAALPWLAEEKRLVSEAVLVASRQDVLEAATGCLTENVLERSFAEKVSLKG